MSIPIVDLAPWYAQQPSDATERMQVAQQLSEAFESTGFAVRACIDSGSGRLQHVNCLHCHCCSRKSLSWEQVVVGHGIDEAIGRTCWERAQEFHRLCAVPECAAYSPVCACFA